MGMAGRKNHQDWEDKNRVFNTVVSFGVWGWEAGEVVLLQLGVKVVVKRGECFMFKRSIIAYKGCAVTSKYCNFIDLFCHKSV